MTKPGLCSGVFAPKFRSSPSNAHGATQQGKLVVGSCMYSSPPLALIFTHAIWGQLIPTAAVHKLLATAAHWAGFKVVFVV